MERKKDLILQALQFDTPAGPMLAMGDERILYLLEFMERRRLGQEIEHLCKKQKATIVPGRSEPIDKIQEELTLYFEGKLTEFKTPFVLLGSSFQKRVWEELQKIPYGETRSYAELAIAIGRPSAFRAVAQANGTNQLAIVIPCHRVINSNGALGGYGGGVMRKKWLLDHEKKENSRK